MSIYDGYLSVGGNEIVNNARTRGIAESAQPCPMYWLKGDTCETMNAALFEQAPYTYEAIEQAPWYDQDVPASADFFGFFAYSITEALDSTRTVPRTEGITHGGVLGRTRKATKTMRVRGILIGRGLRAVEYGQAWLSAAIDPGACGQHGSECGLTDVQWFADCPPPRGSVIDPETNEPRSQTDEEYRETVEQDVRYLHDAAAISGPLILNTLESGGFVGYEVEVIFGAERPWVYGITRDVNLPPTVPLIVQDIPYNLVPYPSAELAAGEVITSRNSALNPSVETDAASWVSAQNIITAAQVVGARSTDIAAVGLASYRVTFTATAAGANAAASIAAQQTVTLPAVSKGRHSINLWATAVIGAGSPTLGNIEYAAIWQNASSATLRTDLLGTNPPSGGAVSAKSIQPPAGATKVVVRALLRIPAWSAGNIVRLYADALAVTTP